MDNHNNLAKIVVKIIVNACHTDIWLPFIKHKTGTATGSGFLLQQYEGLVITNAHVIEGALEIKICWPEISDTVIIATILSYCKERDVAVLKLTQIPTFLQPWFGLDLVDDWQLEQKVLAAGYPDEQRRLAITTGEIFGLDAEAKHNFWEDPELVPLYLEMTAMISPGDSGGALLNQQGQCIGITSAGDPQDHSVNLVIPALVVHSILPVLSLGKKVDLVKLACFYQISYPELRQHLGYDKDDMGVYVTKVFADSSFPELQAGALLIAVKTDQLYHVNANGMVIDNNKRLLPLKLVIQTCNNAKIVVWQQHQLLTLDCKRYKLAAIKEVDLILDNYDYKIVAGLCLAPLTLNHIADSLLHGKTKLAKYLDFHGETCKNYDQAPIIISHIFDNTKASELGILQQGDIIDSYRVENGNFILTTDDNKIFITTLQQAQDDDTLLHDFQLVGDR